MRECILHRNKCEEHMLHSNKYTGCIATSMRNTCCIATSMRNTCRIATSMRNTCCIATSACCIATLKTPPPHITIITTNKRICMCTCTRATYPPPHLHPHLPPYLVSKAERTANSLVVTSFSAMRGLWWPLTPRQNSVWWITPAAKAVRLREQPASVLAGVIAKTL